MEVSIASSILKNHLCDSGDMERKRRRWPNGVAMKEFARLNESNMSREAGKREIKREWRGYKGLKDVLHFSGWSNRGETFVETCHAGISIHAAARQCGKGGGGDFTQGGRPKFAKQRRRVSR